MAWSGPPPSSRCLARAPSWCSLVGCAFSEPTDRRRKFSRRYGQVSTSLIPSSFLRRLLCWIASARRRCVLPSHSFYQNRKKTLLCISNQLEQRLKKLRLIMIFGMQPPNNSLVFYEHGAPPIPMTATPNHALHRTAPAVTAPASGPPSPPCRAGAAPASAVGELGSLGVATRNPDRLIP